MPNAPSVSSKEAVILNLLITRGPELYGLQMVEYSKGELRRGTVYVTLERMTDKGYIESRKESKPNKTGIRKRLYKITEFGKRAFQAHQLLKSNVTNIEVLIR